MKAAIKDFNPNTVEVEQLAKEKRFGNRPGSRFYNAFNYKRIKGKLKVRGESKTRDTTDPLRNFSPERWREIKAEEKNKAHEIKNKKVA